MRYAAGGARRPSANELWRTWLLTGVRRETGDRRRVRGAHVGLKRMLIEGMQVSSEKPYTWKDFSDSMIRQAVGEAMQSMPPADSDLIKLAYFGGLSNRDIALQIRSTETAVERGLRRALDRISDHVRRGRGLTEKLLATVLAWLSGRWLSDHLAPVAPAGVVAAALLLGSASPSTVGAERAPSRPPQPAAVQLSSAPSLSATSASIASPSAPSSTAAAGVPSSAQAPAVSVPALPAVPVVSQVTVPTVTVPSVGVPVVQVPTAVRKATSTVSKAVGKL